MEICSLVRQEEVKNNTRHELYCTWRMMNYRCYSDVHTSFPTYGGAGIYVCEDWRWDNPLGFYNFLRDCWPRPEKHTLDRIDPYGPYSKDNCRWADKRTQQNNFRKETKTESGHLGVVKDGWDNKWVAHIYLHGKDYRVGLSNSLEEAVSMREEALRIKMEYGDAACYEYLESIKVKTPVGKRFYGRKTSKYYGVSWDKRQGYWRAVVARRKEGKLKQVFIGKFKDEETANAAVIKFLEDEKNASSI